MKYISLYWEPKKIFISWKMIQTYTYRDKEEEKHKKHTQNEIKVSKMKHIKWEW